MTRKPALGTQIFVHLYISECKFFGDGALMTIRPIPEGFKHELLQLMAIYRVQQLEAIIMACDREQTITINVNNDKEKENIKKDPALGLGP